MEIFSLLLALCAIPSKRPVTLSFNVFFDLRVNKRLSKQSWAWWFETPSYSLWRHCNEYLTLVTLISHAIPGCDMPGLRRYRCISKCKIKGTFVDAKWYFHQNWISRAKSSVRWQSDWWTPIKHRISIALSRLMDRHGANYSRKTLSIETEVECSLRDFYLSWQKKDTFSTNELVSTERNATTYDVMNDEVLCFHIWLKLIAA